ncbi:hypothetical protein McPS_22990 [Marichromatium sp. PS1]
MRTACGRHRRRYRVTTDSSHRLAVAENLLARDFRPSAPNQVWSADITYLWTDEGWLYLAVVFDLFNREVVGWSMHARMDAELVISALDMAHACPAPSATGAAAPLRLGQPVRQPRHPATLAPLRHSAAVTTTAAHLHGGPAPCAR